MTHKNEIRVPVYHPVQKATANPLKKHLQAWLDQGWVRQDDQPKEEGNSK